MSEEKKIIALVRPLARKMEHLSVDGRIDLLCALIAHEICFFPASERDDARAEGTQEPSLSSLGGELGKRLGLSDKRLNASGVNSTVLTLGSPIPLYG